MIARIAIFAVIAVAMYFAVGTSAMFQRARINPAARTAQIESAVADLAHYLRSFCLHNKRAPTADEFTEFAAQEQKYLTAVSFNEVEFVSPELCRARLKFRADGRDFEVVLPLAERWKLTPAAATPAK